MESNRDWEVDWTGLPVTEQRTITLGGRWTHPLGFRENISVHIPLDTFAVLRKFDPDIVIAGEMGVRSALAALYRRYRPSSKLLIWSESTHQTDKAAGPARRVLRRILAKSADGFITPGESGAHYLRNLGIEDEKIFRVPYSTDLATFSFVRTRPDSASARRLLYVGQLIERKGLVPFLEVLVRWLKAHPAVPVELTFAGEGPLRDHLEGRPLPPNGKLHFLSAVSYSDLPHVYAESDVLVLPTLADTWGLVVNEALAIGRPVLGSLYSQAVEELITDGENGWRFRPDHESEMYDALNSALRTPVARIREMEERARNTAARLTPDFVCGLVENVVARMYRDEPTSGDMYERTRTHWS
jgi:glycosyltransferase involved in cell wall biosynthesis